MEKNQPLCERCGGKVCDGTFDLIDTSTGKHPSGCVLCHGSCQEKEECEKCGKEKCFEHGKPRSEHLCHAFSGHCHGSCQPKSERPRIIPVTALPNSFKRTANEHRHRGDCAPLGGCENAVSPFPTPPKERCEIDPESSLGFCLTHGTNCGVLRPTPSAPTPGEEEWEAKFDAKFTFHWAKDIPKDTPVTLPGGIYDAIHYKGAIKDFIRTLLSSHASKAREEGRKEGAEAVRNTMMSILDMYVEAAIPLGHEPTTNLLRKLRSILERETALSQTNPKKE